MRIPGARVVSSDELTRNIDDHIAAAASGSRIFVLADSDDIPVVALVGLDDLRRLGQLEEPDPEPRLMTAADVDYAALLSATPPGQVPIGIHSDQTPATLSVRGHHLIVARDGYGGDELLTSAIAGAALSWRASELGFVIATSAAASALPARLLEAAHIVSCQPDLRNEVLLARFVEQISAEVRTRRDALRRLGVRSVGDLRERELHLAPHPDLADLVVVIDGVGELMEHSQELTGLISELLTAEGALGLHLWMVNPAPLTTLIVHSMPMPSLLMDFIVSRVALQTFSANHSRETVGVPDAAFISESGVGFHKPDNLTQPRRFRVSNLDSEELDLLADTMARRTGHHMFADQQIQTRWADALPQSISLQDTIAHWEAAGGERNTAAVPIGLVDDAKQHQISPYTVTFNEAMRALMIVGANREHLTSTVDAIVTSAAATNERSMLRFIYIGPPASELRPLFTMPNVDIVKLNDAARLGTVMSDLRQQIDLRSERGHTVLIIDGWDRWQTARIGADPAARPTDLVVDIARRGAQANVHVIVTGTAGFQLNVLDGVTDERIELRLNQAYESQFDKTAAAIVSDDQHHGLTRHGRLLLIDR